MLEREGPAAVPEAAPPAPAPAAVPVAAPAPLGAGEILALQRSAGNAAVARMLDDDPGRAPDEPGGEGEPVAFPAGMTFHEEPEEFVAYAAGPRLQGKTTAHWDSQGHFDPDPPKASKAKGGLRVQGSFVVDYASNPTVKLPDIPDGLTDCQRRNAQKFIDNVLEPHEQQHVKTFKQFFDGTTTNQFDFVAADAAGVRAKVDAGYVAELGARKTKAQAESDKLDANGANQFTWDMDEGCDKP